MSFSSSASRQHGPRLRRLSNREEREHGMLQKMLCWLVNEGSKAMELSLGNNSPLEPRTDLGEQGVRMAEIRKMTAAAYASGRPTRVKYWYSKVYGKKKTMRDEVDMHLAHCSKHPKYRSFRNRIDASRRETSTEESSSSSSESEENQSSSSSSNQNSPLKLRGKIETKQTLDSESSSDSEEPSTVKKRKRVDDSKKEKSISKMSYFSTTEHNGVDIKNVALTQTEVNLPVQKLDGIEATNDESESVQGSPVKKRNWIHVVKIESLQSDNSPPGKKRRMAGDI